MAACQLSIVIFSVTIQKKITRRQLILVESIYCARTEGGGGYPKNRHTNDFNSDHASDSKEYIKALTRVSLGDGVPVRSCMFIHSHNRHPRGIPLVDPSPLGRKILYAPRLPQVLLQCILMVNKQFIV